MKNIFRFLMAAVIFFGAVSCAKEDISTSLAGGEVEVTLSVDVPELGTRAYGDGLTVNQLFIAVYEQGDDKALPISHIGGTGFQDSERFSGGRATVTMVLLKDKTYDLVFWAQNAEANAYTVNLADGRNIVANYGAKCNLEDRDAFFLIRKGWKAGAEGAETTFKLNRPFAQINVANSDADVDFVTKNGATIVNSAMTVKTKVANVLDMKTGDVDGSVDVAFAANTIPDKAFHIAGYNYLAMNYLLVNEKDLVDLKFEFTDNKNVTYTREYGNVPVQRNYRTNILGQIISSPIDFTVVIDPIFDGAHEVTPWNGNDTKPVTPNADGVYEISEASELAWLAAAVNGTRAEGDTYAGKTFVLTQDIDLCGHNWTPIGFNGSFNGIFDGNGKTISNLVVLGYNSTVGLFGTTQNGEIKNVTIKDAKVSGRLNVGVVAGNPYTSKYTNITVKGHIEVNGMAYVGGVGGKNAYANWKDVTVDVDEDSYVHANSVENGTAYRTYVGGVVGFNGEGTHSFTNIKSNVKVEGSTCDVGGLFGIAHYGNKFENCVCEGDVKIFNAEEAEEAEEIGGIAGVWNNGGQDVIMNNVEFKGNIITNVDATVWYGGLVGKPYSATGTGKLIIDGKEMVANGVGIEDGVYYVLSGQGLAWVEAQADDYFKGKTIKLANDIDMTGITIANPIKFWGGRTYVDGQNYTISNLTMSTDSTDKNPFGLFGGTVDIKNVKFDNANINGYSYVAVVAGNMYGNIDNCHVANSTVTCKYWMAGAMSGQYNAGNVTNCSVTNTTVTGPAAVGALVGNINETAGVRKIENCSVSGCTVKQNGSFGGDYDLMFGAAVGLINIKNSKVYFTNCSVENTTVKGEASDLLYGCIDDSTKVNVDGLWYPIVEATTLDEVKDVFANGGTIILAKDITFEKLTTVEPGAEVYMNLNGKTITVDPNTTSNTLIYVKDGGKLVIDGDGIINLGAVSTMAVFAPYGELVIENGTFIRDKVTEVTNKTTGLFMGAKTTASNVTINGGYFDAGYYNADAADIEEILAGTEEFVETADDIAKRGNSKDANKVRVAIKDNVSALLNHSGYGVFKVYGGTFVGANPAWGDEGCMLPTTPNYLRPWSYYQGALLAGQTYNENGVVLPKGYTITKGAHKDGRPTYTVSYSK